MIDVMEHIRKNADEKYNEFNRKLVPGIGVSYGVRVPNLRKIAKLISDDDWKIFLDSEPSCFEEIMLQGLVINIADMPPATRMSYIRNFVPMINNWAVCDAFCVRRRIHKDEKTPLWELCLEEIESGEEFRMRFAVVMMMSNYLCKEHVDTILELTTTRNHEGYYYKMAVAWCISFCYIEFPEKTEHLIFERLDQETMSMTVRKICDSYRVKKKDKDRLKRKKEELSTSPQSP